ncbi:hypothetical protein [Bifidobacterium jacchi]|uniref:Uncharacterized protein n=1 Tax=Bifidobacterium jacchi TaxID=2490545 RepID=A0A5N5RM75_9BIFI|nr:hypothetical protein [Bifidobacterium jacchi]KAB5608397.1 hypothetical protein EHS19_01885 [Bifidobacterium jacchi]
MNAPTLARIYTRDMLADALDVALDSLDLTVTARNRDDETDWQDVTMIADAMYGAAGIETDIGELLEES